MSGHYFMYNKRLHDLTSKTIADLKNGYHQIFRQISDLHWKLSKQNGMAASALERNLSRHSGLMKQNAAVLLNFTDVLKSLMSTIEATDEGSSTMFTPTGRQEWQYALSSNVTTVQIKLDAAMMREAAVSFKSNLTYMDEVFSAFNTMINEVLAKVEIPWDDFSGMWSDAQSMVRSVTEETQHHINALVEDTELFVYELERVDRMLGRVNVGG